MGKNLGKIIFLNAVGLTIFFSWYLPAEHGFWFTLDKSIFYYFNEQLQPESSFTYFVGLTNVRHFDIISLMAMLALYGYYYSKAEIFWQKSFCRQLHYFNNFYAAAYYGRSALVYRYCCRFFKYFFGWFELGFTDAGE